MVDRGGGSGGDGGGGDGGDGVDSDSGRGNVVVDVVVH